MQLQSNAVATKNNNRQERRRLAKQVKKQAGAGGQNGENLGAMVQVAEGLRHAGRFQEAENLWHRLIREYPEQPQPLAGLGMLLCLRGRHGEAYPIYKKAVTIAPNEFVLWRQFAACLNAIHQPEAASIAFKKALALNPSNIDTRIELAQTLSHAAKGEEALEAFDTAVSMAPNNPRALLGKAIQLELLGRQDEAKAAFHEAIAADKKNVVAYLRLATLNITDEEARDLLVQLEDLTSGEGLNTAGRAGVWFSCAHLHNRLKEYDAAFETYRRANETLKKQHTFDRKFYLESIDTSIEAYTPEVFEKLKDAGSQSTQPIFIVGMPRSGTTLVESILSSHPGIDPGGELAKMSEITNALQQAGGKLRFPEDIAEMNPAHLVPFGTQYLSHLAKLQPGSKKTTDKLPFNCLYLGLIAVLFPKATIIHCMRDPLDTCLSCYFQNFAEAKRLSFTLDLDDLAYVYTHYRRLMDHWREVLPLKIMDVQYEELIQDQEAVSRRIVAHAGEEWDDACLAFHEQERNVMTASASQVRRPIYKSSMERWRRYEKHIGPLKQALGIED